MQSRHLPCIWLYILSISDTLDPVKKYCTGSELSAMEVLKNVSFDFVPGRRSMMVSVNKSVSIDPIYEAANSLKTWTVATVSSKTDNSFMISL